MIDLHKVRAVYGDACFLDISNTAGRRTHGIPESNKAAAFAHRDFEGLLKVPFLRRGEHIINLFDTAPLHLPDDLSDKDEVLT